MQGLVSWLFTDPQTAGLNTASGKPEVFHFYLPWIIFCALGLILPIYYALEGRKRFVGHHALNKYVLDRIMNYLWALWGAGLAIYWLYYFIFRYADDLAWYRNKRTMEKYYPQPRQKRKTAKAGAR